MKRIYGKCLVNLGLALLTLLVFIFVVPKVLVFFLPFVIGWLIAWVANPLVKFFEEKLNIRRKAGSAFVIIAVIALILLLGYLAASKLISEGVGFITSLPDLWNTLEEDFRDIGQNMSIFYNRLPLDVRLELENFGRQMETLSGEVVSRLSTPTVNAVSSFAKNLPSVLIGIIMCILSAYFFIAEKDYLGRVCTRYMPESALGKWKLVSDSLKSAVGGYLKAQLKIECWIYLLLLLGFAVLDINYAVLIALVIACLDFLPFFGTGAVMIPWALIKFLSADYKMTIGLLIIWGVGQLVRQIIQPKIVGDSIGVAPIPTLFLLFIGYKAAGVLGMILAVPIGIIIFNMNEAGVFDTAKNSVLILADGINGFRRFDAKELPRQREAAEPVEARRQSETQEARKAGGQKQADPQDRPENHK